jgi:hypothetical protein
MMTQENSRSGIAVGVLLIFLGAVFLTLQFLQIKFWADWWPIAIIGVGLLFFIAMLVSGKGGGPLAIPGSVIVMVGLILLFHNTFGFWETWAYAWTLLIFAAGIGINIFGRYTGQEKVRHSGAVVARLGLLLFVIFAIFFELFIGLSGVFDGSSLLWPLLLILVGVYMLLARSGLFSALFSRRKPVEPIYPPAPSVAETTEVVSPPQPVADPFHGTPLPVEIPEQASLLTSHTESDRDKPLPDEASQEHDPTPPVIQLGPTEPPSEHDQDT